MNGRIEWIKQNIDPVLAAEDLLGPPSKQVNGSLLWICPRHDDHSPSLRLNTAGSYIGLWRCFPCGQGGDIIDLYTFVTGASTSEAIAALCPIEASRFPRKDFDPAGELRSFLAGRQWSKEVTDTLGITSVCDSYGWGRIRFPFRRRGVDVYWQDRAAHSGAKTKWLSKEGPTPCPYEVDRIGNVGDDGWLLVVEGLPDVVAIVHHYPAAAVIGLAGANTFKTEWTRYVRDLRLCVFADNDDAGAKMRRNLDDLLTPHVKEIYHACVPLGFNDLDAWRQDDPESFPYQIGALLDGYPGLQADPGLHRHHPA